MARRSTLIDAQAWIDAQDEKIRRIMGRAARLGAEETRKNILGGSPTGSQWHVMINKMRGNQFGARKETGKMFESVKFSRPAWNPETKMWEASFGFPFSPSGFGGIRDTRSSAKYQKRVESMRNPKFRPWAADKNYIAMQEYGSEMPGSNVKVGMHATRRALAMAEKYAMQEFGKLYKKVK